MINTIAEEAYSSLNKARDKDNVAVEHPITTTVESLALDDEMKGKLIVVGDGPAIVEMTDGSNESGTKVRKIN